MPPKEGTAKIIDDVARFVEPVAEGAGNMDDVVAMIRKARDRQVRELGQEFSYFTSPLPGDKQATLGKILRYLDGLDAGGRKAFLAALQSIKGEKAETEELESRFKAYAHYLSVKYRVPVELGTLGRDGEALGTELAIGTDRVFVWGKDRKEFRSNMESRVSEGAKTWRALGDDIESKLNDAERKCAGFTSLYEELESHAYWKVKIVYSDDKATGTWTIEQHGAQMVLGKDPAVWEEFYPMLAAGGAHAGIVLESATDFADDQTAELINEVRVYTVSVSGNGQKQLSFEQDSAKDIAEAVNVDETTGKLAHLRNSVVYAGRGGEYLDERFAPIEWPPSEAGS